MMDDADYVFVMTNSFSSMAKAEIKRLREKGNRIGLARLRMIRPFPHEEIQRILRGRKGVAVIDQNISVGKGGILLARSPARSIRCMIGRRFCFHSLAVSAAEDSVPVNSPAWSIRWKPQERMPPR